MKRLFLIVSVLLLTMVVIVGCKHNKTDEPDTFTLDKDQQESYDKYIDAIFDTATSADIPADTVKTQVAVGNALFQATNAGFMIKDKQEGKPIKKGTSKEALRKRFIPVKAQ